MTTIVCKMWQCPYNDGLFCAKFGTIGIDKNGMCSVLWRNGVRVYPTGPFDDKVQMKVEEEEQKSFQQNGQKAQDLGATAAKNKGGPLFEQIGEKEVIKEEQKVKEKD